MTRLKKGDVWRETEMTREKSRKNTAVTCDTLIKQHDVATRDASTKIWHLLSSAEDIDPPWRTIREGA